ncbi:MAG: nuclear transport factor 2 family protein [Opitutaceae bacterium]|jgi:ketosteroid isomerase-like protein
MKTIRRNICASVVCRIVCFISSLLCGVFARAAEVDSIAAVRAVDDERVVATVAADKVRLDQIYSEGLRYAHANGKIDDKAQHIAALADKKTSHDRFDYQVREFRSAGPGVVLMSGRLLIHTTSAKGKSVNDVNFLAVWRKEAGGWRLFDWQAAKNPAPLTTTN